MKKVSFVNRLIENLEKIEQSNNGIREGISNQSALLNNKFDEVIEGLNNEQGIVNNKLGELIDNLNSFQADSNVRLSEIADQLGRNNNKIDDLAQILNNFQGDNNLRLSEISDHLGRNNNNSDKMIEILNNFQADSNLRLSKIADHLGNDNNKFEKLIENINSFQADSNLRLSAIIDHLYGDSLRELITRSLTEFVAQAMTKLIAGAVEELILNSADQQKSLEAKLDKFMRILVGLHTQPSAAPAPQSVSLLRAPKTYNTDHPDYEPALVRNFPGVLFNSDKPSANPALRAVKQIIEMHETNNRAWPEQLEMALAELQSIPGAEQLFQRKAVAEHFFQDINSRYEADYQPGWVNLNDGLFLYWLVRRLRPRIAIETGVANGFSTGLILLAMAKNGNGGKLHSIGRATIFDTSDPRWTQKGKLSGEVVLVDGKNLGWMVPDNCRNSVEFYTGDAKALLPETVNNLDSIDLFFHDSDHSYDHMMFEFEAAKHKLSPGGVVVADNISWNSSLWDFADTYGVPAYNFRGSIGAAFFG